MQPDVQSIASMRVDRLEHVQLAMPVGGEALARAFYGGILGIPEMPKSPDLAARAGCWFERADLKIHLGVDSECRPAREGVAGAHTIGIYRPQAGAPESIECM
jgi:hypothetical protein